VGNVGNNPLSVTDPSGEGFFDFLNGLIHDILNAFSGGLWGALTAAIEGGSPPVGGFGGVPGVGDLTGCGGALGNCGGSGTWSEDAGLTNVQNPGQFVSNVLQVQAAWPGMPMEYSLWTWDVARAYLMQVGAMAQIIKSLETSRTVYTIRLNNQEINNYDEKTHTVNWDPTAGLGCTTGGTQSPALGLGHELAHALGPRLPYLFAPDGYDNIEEKRVITGPERAAARALGECVRNNHRGTRFHVPNPILH
jgi:hypothetical protein